MKPLLSAQTATLESTLARLPTMINVARLAILLSLLTFHLLLSKDTNLPQLPAPVFYIWAGVYGLAIVSSALYPGWQAQPTGLPSPSSLFDIIMMVILMHLAGGVTSGFGILILPFIATACLMSAGQHPLTYASFATLLVFFSTAISKATVLEDLFRPNANIQPVFLTGLLASAFFMVALITAFVAINMRRATQTVHAHEEEITRLSSLNEWVLNRVQEAVVVLDAQQHLWLHNQQAQLYFPKLTADESLPMFLPLINRWQQQPSQAFEEDLFLGDQNMHVRALPSLRQNPPLLMLFIRSAKDVAAEAHSVKLASLGQLTANIAHEIRNPLSAIRHANDLLAENNPDPMATKLAQMIDSNVRRIDHMVEEVLTLNKRDRINTDKINLADFLRRFGQEFLLANPTAKGCLKIQMHHPHVVVLFDSGHLQQIVWNLTNNAWRHSQQNAEAITIRVQAHAHSGHIALNVIDNGAGVPPGLRERIFEPFFTTEQKGSGLGLYVARELAQANQGDLTYQADANGFEIRIPTYG